MTRPAPFIELRDVTVSYADRSSPDGRLTAVEKFCLEVPKGEFVALVGPNACGKTTLLLTLAGILTPDSGIVMIEGKPAAKATCGYVFQNYRESLYPWLTVLDNIALPLSFAGLAKMPARDKARDLVRRLGVSLPLDRFPYTLSGGQQQLTAILRGVVLQPSVLLLDEPFGSLDVGARQELQQALHHVWQEIGATTVLVTHDPDEAMVLANRVVALSSRPARVVQEFPMDELRPRSVEAEALVGFRQARERLYQCLGGHSKG
jgi:NitT/TauT family transport system ATP-binding protein